MSHQEVLHLAPDGLRPLSNVLPSHNKQNQPLKRILYLLLVLVSMMVAASCSTKKNTASTRRWQAFVTRYNVYFNAEQAYIEGRKAQDKSLKENYAETLPLFGVGYEKQRTIGQSNFETAITKCEKAIQLHSIKKKPAVNNNKTLSPAQKAYLSRKEFNPFLKNAWLLMGKAQFQKGEFAEAASSFAYITRFYAAEPAVVAEARIWLARCYAELEWFYDAEDVIQRMGHDTIPARLSVERDLTMADFYIRQDKLEDALPYLKRAVKKEKSKARKAREYYLLAQALMELDHKAEAYKALSKCIAQSPEYEMSFHARILQTEALTTSANARSMVKRLKRMSRSDNNKDYQDQIYYAIGNIYLQQNDTLQAISSYETGRAKATQKGTETALLLLRLGGLYWDQRRFEKAQPCYTEAIGLLDKEHAHYKEVAHRSKVLDALVPPTSAIFLQDSLQWLASIDETQRNEAIDRVIDALKKKEAEERKARRDSAADERMKDGGFPDNMGNKKDNLPTNQLPGGMMGSKDWYFYNQQMVMQGKQAFQKEWGNRKNEDDWRRRNRTVLAQETNEGFDYEAEDSIANVRQQQRDSLLATGMSEKDIKRWFRDHEAGTDDEQEKKGKEELKPEEDPHERAYYMAQIPFSPEQKASSDSIIRESLYEAAVIEKDQLEDFALAAETFNRLTRQFPTFSQMDEVTYHQYLMYSRWSEQERRNGHAEQAAIYKEKAYAFREKMRVEYPSHIMTSVICDPDFETNARYARELEDTLYTQTYEAYRRGDNALVEENARLSAAKYPKGANRPKFIFIHALSQLGTAPADSISSQLRQLVQDYPKSDVAEMAGMIVKGLEAGREIGSGAFDLGSLWSRRTAEAQAGLTAIEGDRALKADRDVPFVFLIAYPTGDVKADDALLYGLARFNFSAYIYRGFDISKERDKNLTRFTISGFRSFDDVHNYAQRIFREDNVRELLRDKRIELISEDNLKKLGSLYSYEDYRQFYEENFAPLDINPELPLEFAPEEDEDGIEYEEPTPTRDIIYSRGEQTPVEPVATDQQTPETEREEDDENAPGGTAVTTDDNGELILDDVEIIQPKPAEDYYDAGTEPARREVETIVVEDVPIVVDDEPAVADDEYIDAEETEKKAAKDDDLMLNEDESSAGKKTKDDEEEYYDE